MTTPLISFCIATFNRATYISQTMDCLVGQLSDDVEIVVLDGGSKDETESIMLGYVAACPAVRYVRQATNHGVDRDYDGAVQAARGKYCWLMTDDDILKPGAVAAIRAALQTEPSLVVVNAEVRDALLERVYEPSRLKIADDRTFAPDQLGELFAVAGELLTFIGSVVIRREVWLARQRESYYGTLFIHVGVIFQSPLPGSIRVLATSWISIRYGNAMWHPREFEIWMFKWPSLVWSFDTLPDSSKSAVTPREPWRNPIRLMFYRAKGTYWSADYDRLLRPKMRGSIARFVAWFVSILPGTALNAITLAYFQRFHPTHGAVISDLLCSCFHYRNRKAARESRK
jgi:glycosyltransferase involved in cell wall biosynthesis